MLLSFVYAGMITVENCRILIFLVRESTYMSIIIQCIKCYIYNEVWHYYFLTRFLI